MNRAAPYAVSDDGKHSFSTGVGDERVVLDLALTGRQVAFLADNPAAVRCCLLVPRLTVEWLDRLIVSVLAVGPGLEPAEGIH